MNTNYLCNNWQGFLQIIIYMMSRGYYNYCLTILPEKKKSKWLKIDKKLITKYEIGKSKFQRARQKAKGQANFYYLRWESCALLLHTSGNFNINIDDKFLDVREKPLLIKISDNIKFEVKETSEDKKLSVWLNKDSYKGFKLVIADVCRTKKKPLIIKEYDKINGLPAWKGIIIQKHSIAEYAVKQAKKNNFKLLKKELRINTRRKLYKVF